MDKYDQLERLAELKSKGALTEEEFSAQKEKILAENVLSASKPIPNTKVIHEKKEGTYWPSGFSLGLASFSCLMLLDTSTGWDYDTVLGLAIFSVLALIIGSISVSTQTKGRKIAIAGIILSTITCLCALVIFLLCFMSEDGTTPWLS